MRRLLKLAAGVAGLLACAAIGLGVSVSLAAPGDQIIVPSGGYRCDGPIDVDLLRVTNPGNSAGLSIDTGCEGRIGRLEISGVRNDDGVKVQNSGPSGPLHVGGGYVQCAGPPTDGTHQDGVQAMGGRNITFRNLVIDCYGGGGGNWFVNRGGGGATTPTNIVCEHCAMGPHHSNQVNGATSVNSGVRDSLLCTPRLGRVWRGNQSVNVGNTIVPASDPRCANVETLEAWITGTRPGPQPEPEPEPEPEPGPECDDACVAAYEQRIDELEQEIADLRAELDAAGANEAVLLAEIARLEAILAEIEELAATV